MTEWRKCKLEEVVSFASRGITPKYCDLNGVIVINQKCIREGRVNIAEARLTDNSKNSIPEAKFIKNGDVLINSTGTGTLGRVGIVKDLNCLATVDSHVTIIRSNSKADNYFLGYVLINSQKEIEFMAEGSTGQTELYCKRLLSELFINLPPLHEQKAIAEVLSSFDDKIDLLTRQNKTLEDLAQTYFRKWFIEDSAKSRTVQISDIIDFNPPRYLAKGTIAPYLEMANVSTSVFHPDDWYNREYSSGTKFVNGDTLFARITPCLENGKSTYVTFLNKGQVGWGSTEFIVMHTKNDLHPFLSYLLTKNEEFRDHAESCLEGSSGRQRVNIDHLLNFKIQVPNEKIAQTFNLIMEDIVLKLHHNFMQIRTLSKLRDILLPKLISGEIRVKM